MIFLEEEHLKRCIKEIKQLHKNLFFKIDAIAACVDVLDLVMQVDTLIFDNVDYVAYLGNFR